MKKLLLAFALLSLVGCPNDNTTTTDSGSDASTGPAVCQPRASTSATASARTIAARGFGSLDGMVDALSGHSVEIFSNNVVTAGCEAPNCARYTVSAAGEIMASLSTDWYAYRVVTPTSSTRQGLTTLGFNRMSAGTADTVFQVSAGTRQALMGLFGGRMHNTGTAAIAGTALSGAGAPQGGAMVRVFVNNQPLTVGMQPTDAFVGYFTGTAASPTPSATATSVDAMNGRWAAGNVPVGAGAKIRVEVVQNGAVTGCEEMDAYPNGVTLINIVGLRSDYPTCSGCYPHRAQPSDGGTSDASTSDASTSDAATSDASTSDAATSDAGVQDASSNG